MASTGQTKSLQNRYWFGRKKPKSPSFSKKPLNLKMNRFSCIAMEDKCCFPLQNKHGNSSSKPYKSLAPSSYTARSTSSVYLFMWLFKWMWDKYCNDKLLHIDWSNTLPIHCIVEIKTICDFVFSDPLLSEVAIRNMCEEFNSKEVTVY